MLQQLQSTLTLLLRQSDMGLSSELTACIDALQQHLATAPHSDEVVLAIRSLTREWQGLLRHDDQRLLDKDVHYTALRQERNLAVADLMARYAPLDSDASLHPQAAPQPLDHPKAGKLKQALDSKNKELKAIEKENARLTKQLNKLTASMSIASAAAAPTVSIPQLATGVFNLLGDNKELTAVMTAAAGFCQDRLIFTDNAYATAREYLRQEYSPMEVLQALLRLVFDYLPLYLKGGDNSARHVFGAAYSANESDSVMRNAKTRELREFKINGKKQTVESHLSINRFLRIYFYVDREQDTVVIPYVGAHLPCSSGF